MQEFSALSVSSYEAGSLADRLTEQSRDGWSVVAIVPTGSTVTAYLSRESDGTAVAAAEESPVVVEPTPAPADEPAAEEAEPVVPVAAAVAATQVEEPAAEPAPEPAAEPVADTATASSTAAAAGAAPAGWYADPSGRFELRYWDGGQWTEHVSRAGQQYTDPPIA